MIVTITGQNDFLRTQELQALQTKFVQEHGDAGVEKIAGESVELGRLLDSLQAQSLFSSDRLVVVRDLSSNKAATEKIDIILDAVSDGVDLILHEPSLDLRTSFAKALQKQTDFRRLDQLRDFELADWLAKTATQAGGSLNKAAANLLVQRVGTDQQLLSSELQKLLAYNPNVDRDSIELLSVPSPQSSIFDLLASAFQGDKRNMLRLYRDQRAQNVEPQAILSMMAWQLHAILATKLGGQQNPNDIAKAAGLSPYVVRNSQSLARSLPLTRIKVLMEAIIELEITMKSQAIDVDDAVQTLLLGIA